MSAALQAFCRLTGAASLRQATLIVAGGALFASLPLRGQSLDFLEIAGVETTILGTPILRDFSLPAISHGVVAFCVVGEGQYQGVFHTNARSFTAGCEADFRDPDGQLIAEEAVAVPSGQVAQFAINIGAGFSGSSRLTCDQEVVVVALIQDQENAFPTSLNYLPLP